ncbi:hypothetical protein SAMN04488570_1848 [Nocardioides scoriae]|uniref:Uncharacterized protein n=1 Tax=Nocardioides scoriae TaxID=642780 RepID=A0A1H1S328_9ACTN|nr:hypothetical protein [Nocardioides scoriae]SDS42344.1 hypothetical protein SAMN04488570_1848 [Nocardioides scoriae]
MHQREPLTAAEREARRRRLAEVFGDVLPEQTRDDRVEVERTETAEDRLRRDVPPHHGPVG